MKPESFVFLLPGAFFLVVGTIYGTLTSFRELVGFPALLLAAGLALMVGIYFRMLGKRHGERPEDREDGRIAEEAGDQGLYAPWSWWPFVVALGSALGFVALAVGWWIMVPAAMVSLVGLIGWVFEYSTGRFAH
ncbi:cytochrome c oxidase subunit 4 [Demequina sp. TTPB684]|uniref:cytochrome c oxidase subunit 4 n=1 Tax=unclassified Demequina TaxID=2620311 RepID=UPI001CF3D644|nr:MULTISPECIES: cytochrome c oxidase subunit 4 [unclassified Demequina]MCB2413827.1 cytochrome c oxidase subunit 4 [Demequina sp. TTPB684]UPU89139.1 cytochrome c oxidase subunit 4 [Demequina sp. TMPB413]